MAKKDLGLNPNHYEPVSCDNKKIVLKHKKGGHEVHISVDALSPQFRQKLHQFAKGGKVSIRESIFGKTIIKEDKEPKDKKHPFGKTIMKDDNSKDGRSKARLIDELPDISDDDDKKKYNSGGSVERVDKKKAADMSKGAMSGGPSISQGIQNIKTGLGFAEGGDVEEEVIRRLKPDLTGEDTPIENPYAKEIEQRQFNIMSQMSPNEPQIEAQGMSKEQAARREAINQTVQAKQQAEADVAAEVARKEEMAKRGAMGQAQENQQLQMLGLQPASNPQPAGAPQQPVEQPSLAPQPQPAAQPAVGGDLMKGYAQERAGLQLESQAMQQQAKAEVAAINEKQKAFDDLQLMQQEVNNDLKQTQEALEHDIKNNLVDPNRFWTGYTDAKGNKVEGHSKLAAIIGMVIAGFQPMGGPNMAIDFLNKEIDRNLNAQEKNIQTKQNLLRANLDKFKSRSDAILATRAMLNDDLQRRLTLAAANSRSELAKAAAMKAIGQLQRQQHADVLKLQSNQLISKIIGASKSNPGQVARMLDALEGGTPEQQKQAQELRGRFIPKLGAFAQTNEDAKELKEMDAGITQAKQGINDLLAIQNKPLKSLSLSDRARAQTIQQTLVGAMRLPITGPGAMNEGEREMLQSIIRNPTTIFSLDSSTKAALKTLSYTLDAKFAATAQSKGIDVPTPSMTQSHDKARAYVQQNLNSKDPAIQAKVKQIQSILGE